ncbi:MAG: RluA family pseudouridine synthase [Bacteroidetes bacterium]|nr:RluA family pseudouridine synthase [Bacteroidota bacterium]MDF1864472.1 RluA family pseudouridine synthase [Saprospiraceae bacterium]
MNEGLQILHEDNHLIAINKPAGWLVQGDNTGDVPLSEYVKQYIKDRYNKPGDVFLGVIHRLDRPVSGVVIFARTTKALQRMNKLFADREVEKTYWAIVGERPDPISGHLTDYIVKDKKRNVAKALDRPSNRNKDAKKADLDYYLIGSIGDNHLLKVKPETGRPHQIRVQLAKMGCSIRGDVKYGFSKVNQDASIHLHSRSLSFIHPVKKEPVYIEADLPDEQIWNLFKDVD